MVEEIKLSKLELRLLYNFVIGERNRIQFPNIDCLKNQGHNISVEVKVKPMFVNLNNFSGDIEKYNKVLGRLVKKLNVKTK